MSPRPAIPRPRPSSWLPAVLGLVFLPQPAARAGEADIEAVQVRCDARRVCRFAVTVRHADEGWDHYADRWEVLAPDGEVLAARVLRHPHVDEQPFTRGLAGVKVPAGVERVRIRARDSVHGYGGAERTVELEFPSPPSPSGSFLPGSAP